MIARIAPSILSADFANLEAELASIDSADLIHVDVMDGHFVPNLTIGLPVVARLAEVSSVPLDTHLMIEDPEAWAGRYAEVSSSVTFHFEAATNPKAVIADIKSNGAKACVAIKPGTDFSQISDLVHSVDMILLMTVEPGFGGQGLIRSVIPKVTEARAFITESGFDTSIQVDGGITLENIAEIARAGADTFVAGTAVFKNQDRRLSIANLRSTAITL
jgi:ribulose-phosphate 3-epimerase